MRFKPWLLRIYFTVIFIGFCFSFPGLNVLAQDIATETPTETSAEIPTEIPTEVLSLNPTDTPVPAPLPTETPVTPDLPTESPSATETLAPVQELLPHQKLSRQRPQPKRRRLI
jgi:hypothetical protein